MNKDSRSPPTSPHKLRMHVIRAKSATREDYRALDDVPIGQRHPCYALSVAECKQYDSSGKVISNPDNPKYTIIVKYSIGIFKYFTYLPSDYHTSDKPKAIEMANGFETSIKEGDGISLVYYGKSGGRHQVDLLEADEEINEETIKSCALDISTSNKRKQKT